MKEWNKGTIEFTCVKCGIVVAKENASIRHSEKATLFVYCTDCVKKLNMRK